jgi:peptide/nickel transport system substrate-binding protein
LLAQVLTASPNSTKNSNALNPLSSTGEKPPKNPGLDLISLSNSTALFGALRSGEVDVLLSASIDEDQRHALNQQAKRGDLHETVGPAMEIGYCHPVEQHPHR